MFLEELEIFHELNMCSMIIRTLLAMLFGGILGYEREKKHRPAGFRTYTLVCLGSALAMMTGIYITTGTGSGDASRIAAQVISGIGFLGAGTILVTKQNHVKGLTTAAGLWVVACLGLAAGAGFYSGAVIGFIAAWASLKIMQLVDNQVYACSTTMSIYVEFPTAGNVTHFLNHVREQHCSVSNLELIRSDFPEDILVLATMTLHFPEAVPHIQILETYRDLEDVNYIEEV